MYHWDTAVVQNHFKSEHDIKRWIDIHRRQARNGYRGQQRGPARSQSHHVSWYDETPDVDINPIRCITQQPVYQSVPWQMPGLGCRRGSLNQNKGGSEMQGVQRHRKRMHSVFQYPWSKRSSCTEICYRGRSLIFLDHEKDGFCKEGGQTVTNVKNHSRNCIGRAAQMPKWPLKGTTDTGAHR